MLKEKGRCVLASFQGPSKEVFGLAKLHDFFEIFPDMATAMKASY
jgi:hypothetical protein